MIGIRVLVRRHLVAHSNTGGGVLARVAWAAATPSGQIAFHEQFRAPGSVAYVGTIGGMKDAVHEAIVRRVATASLFLAAGPASGGRWPVRGLGRGGTTLESREAAGRLRLGSLPGLAHEGS